MADVFLSYAKVNRGRAEQVASALTYSGWDVWWDPELIPGERFREAIHRELNAARCVVVLWSEASIQSDFVIGEAGEGKDRDVLVQAIIDNVRPPLGFREIHYADLIGWDGWNEHPGVDDLRRGISRHVMPGSTPIRGDVHLAPGVIQGPTATLPAPAPQQPPLMAPRRANPIWAAVVIVVIVVLGWIWWASS